MLAEKYPPRYTIEDYQTWQGDWELIEGVPYAMAPSPFGVHQAVAGELLVQFKQQLKQCPTSCFAYMELDWQINDDTVVRPDLQVVCGAPVKHFVTATPHLIAEVVSPKRAQHDEHFKFELYQQEKVPYYLLLYPNLKKARLFKLIDNHYDKVADTNHAPLSIQLNESCTIQLDIPALFAEQP